MRFTLTRRNIDIDTRNADGPAGRKDVTRLAWWDPKPVPEAGMFLHVRPKIEFVQSPTEPEA